METFERTDWYVVFTAFRAEKRVKERLDKAGVENDFPLEVRPCRWGGKVCDIQIPLLSGCLFVKVEASRLAEVAALGGVVSFLRREGRPVAATDRQMGRFRELLEEGKADFAAFGKNI